jgi:hypothetical protein
MFVRLALASLAACNSVAADGDASPDVTVDAPNQGADVKPDESVQCGTSLCVPVAVDPDCPPCEPTNGTTCSRVGMSCTHSNGCEGGLLNESFCHCNEADAATDADANTSEDASTDASGVWHCVLGV